MAKGYLQTDVLGYIFIWIEIKFETQFFICI